MTQIVTVGLFSLTSLITYLFSISAFTSFTPQLVALFSIILIIFTIYQKKYFIFFVSFLINLIVFTTYGLNSPVFFLIYFLLFTIAFQYPPSVTLAYSLVLVIFFSQSLNSIYSLIPLLSILIITPLAWFMGKQYLENFKLQNSLAKDETDFLLWLSLKFKTGIISIIDTTSQLLSQPQLTHSQKEQLHHIKKSANSLLNSSQKLGQEIDQQTDDP